MIFVQDHKSLFHYFIALSPELCCVEQDGQYAVAVDTEPPVRQRVVTLGLIRVAPTDTDRQSRLMKMVSTYADY